MEEDDNVDGDRNWNLNTLPYPWHDEKIVERLSFFSRSKELLNYFFKSLFALGSEFRDWDGVSSLLLAAGEEGFWLQVQDIDIKRRRGRAFLMSFEEKWKLSWKTRSIIWEQFQWINFGNLMSSFFLHFCHYVQASNLEQKNCLNFQKIYFRPTIKKITIKSNKFKIPSLISLINRPSQK